MRQAEGGSWDYDQPTHRAAEPQGTVFRGLRGQTENISRMGKAWSSGHGAWSQSLSNQLSDGASEQIAMAAGNASARAMKTNLKELATD
jgi:biotin-(acetyl-CoA carboxylase) ligase